MTLHTALQDDLNAAQRCLDELARTVSRIERHAGEGLETRRVRTDAAHLRESLALLRAAAEEAGAGRAPAGVPPEMVTIPDKPYDHGLWSDVDDEGVGARDRRAP